MPQSVPLLLLPGLLCDAALWDHQTRFLRDVANITVADLTGADSMAGMAQAALANAPPRFALAGLSMGGYVSFEIMRQAPERVTKLALLDTGSRAAAPEAAERGRLLIPLAESSGVRAVVERLVPLEVHPERRSDERLTGAIIGMADRVGEAAFVRQQRAILARPDSRPDLASISCPTLVLCGREDALTPLELSVEMASAIPAARLSIIEECGHMSTMEQPHAVTAMLRDWLLYA